MIYKLVRIIMYPFVRFILPHFSDKLKKRIFFENKYQNQKDCDYIFHISSEGELEQSLTLIRKLLEQYTVLILFTSESVEKKVLDLKSNNLNLFIECLPVVNYLPFSKRDVERYKKHKMFFMVRYDFFPELIYFSYKSRSVLINSSLIGKENTLGFKKAYLKFAYNSFDKLVFASESEKALFKSFGITKDSFSIDLRALEIYRRLENKESLLESKFFGFESLLKVKEDKVILGSFWSDEYDLIRNALKESIKKGDLIFIVPHDFHDLKRTYKKLNKDNISYCVLDESKGMDLSENIQVYIIKIKGILCELYSYFDYAYIGGGVHRSIHSVLEPFVAGIKFISCGEKIHRSTEFSFIKGLSATRIESFNAIDSFKRVVDNNKIDFEREINKKFKELVFFLGV